MRHGTRRVKEWSERSVLGSRDIDGQTREGERAGANESKLSELRRDPFLPFLSYQRVSKGVEELRCRDEVRVER